MFIRRRSVYELLVASLALAGLAGCLHLPAPAVPISTVNRLHFLHQLRIVRDGWTKAQVQRVLGQPPDIWPPNDSSHFVMAGDEAWCYGTDGHHSLPTLGRVVFREGKVAWTRSAIGEPPPTMLISEGELASAMRKLYRRGDPFTTEYGDSLAFIQETNALLPLGKDKALAVVMEYTRVAGHTATWPFWLARVLFVPKDPPGSFPLPAIGVIDPLPAPGLWPTGPIITIDDVPISLCEGVSGTGQPEPFSRYARDNAKDWDVRDGALRPPDDPFPVYSKVLSSPYWPYDAGDERSPEYEGHVLREILRLVRTAYRPNGIQVSRWFHVDVSDYDKFHKEFLALGCRWDEARQMYVRKDGSFTPDSFDEYPQFMGSIPNLPGLHVKFTVSRSDPESFEFYINWDEFGKQRVAPAIVSFIDAQSRAELFWHPLNVDLPLDATKEQVFKLPPHPAKAGESDTSALGQLGTCGKLRVVVTMDGKKYEGAVLPVGNQGSRAPTGELGGVTGITGYTDNVGSKSAR